MAYQPVVRHPAFVSFDNKFRAQLSIGASMLVPQDMSCVMLFVDPEEKILKILPFKKHDESTIKIRRDAKSKRMRISIGLFALDQLKLRWREDIKSKRFSVAINREHGVTLTVDLAKPLR